MGQRQSLDQWLKLHYIATTSNAWGGAGETLEDASADFALSELAGRVGDTNGQTRFLERAGYWRNLINPKTTATRDYFQNRNADGSWPAFTPATDDGFVETTALVYLWMVPFDVQSLFDTLGGTDKTAARLDAFFHNADDSWALTNAGPLHPELNNEPSVSMPWLYDVAAQPWKTQQAVRIVVDTIWKNTPDGIPGNDDHGEMSSWYVWATLGMYPEIPDRTELVLGSPLFSHAVVHGAAGDVTIDAPIAASAMPYVQALSVNGKPHNRPWLTPAFVEHGGTLDYTLSANPNKNRGSAVSD